MVDQPNTRFDLKSLRFANARTVDFRTRGATGLPNYGGYIYEDDQDDLQGQRGLEVYRRMGSNDATCGAYLNLIDRTVRQVKWPVEPVSSKSQDKQAAEFFESCLDDMDTTWTDTVAEIMSMVQYGFSLHELIYKRRMGQSDQGWLNSKHTDGRIGLRGLPIRAQETITRWLTDDCGQFVAVEQIAPPKNQVVQIPWQKLALFRTSARKNNPYGLSVFRPAYRAWKIKRAIENIEAIGVERDLAGIPLLRVPPEILNPQTPEEQQQLQAIKEIGNNIRKDEQASLILPSTRDENNNLLYDFQLVSSSGNLNFDTSKIIDRWDSRMLAAMQAEFILMGQGTGASGSYAMHQDKTDMFAQSTNVLCDIICEVINRFVVPRLFMLNDFKISEYPRLTHSRVGNTDIKMTTEAVRNLAQSGAAIWPNPELEARFMELLDLPAPVAAIPDAKAGAPIGKPTDDDLKELHEGMADPVPAPGATDQAHGMDVGLR